MSISQELFDETVLENQDVFELTPEQALQETLSQYSKLDLSHLCLSHPSNHTEERASRNAFVETLVKLDDCVQQDGTLIVAEDTLECLKRVQESCTSSRDDTRAYLVLLQQHEGIYTLLSFLAVQDDSNILLQTIHTLISILTPRRQNDKEVQSQLRDHMGAIMDRWMLLYCHYENDWKLQSSLLELAYVSCRSNETNKTRWMKAAASHDGVARLMTTLQTNNNGDDDDQLWIHACKLVTVLCKFDDFRVRKDTSSPIVSSAHDHVLEFARCGAVPILFAVAQQANDNKRNDLLQSSLSALRVMAIQDDVVQSMVAVGILPFVYNILQPCRYNVAAATLGLVRNLCANDQVKSTLCMGEQSIVPGLLAAMQAHPKDAALQEHACGTLAAMALRKPRNSQYLVMECHGHVDILAAMRQHPTNVLVQRQGALALRNLASRSGAQLLKEALLDSGAEAVLREAAGQHQASVDEAYAALRDLGCAVTLLKIKEHGEVVEQTAMFGDTKPVFRPVFEESTNTS